MRSGFGLSLIQGACFVSRCRTLAFSPHFELQNFRFSRIRAFNALDLASRSLRDFGFRTLNSRCVSSRRCVGRVRSLTARVPSNDGPADTSRAAFQSRRDVGVHCWRGHGDT
jgi:hypothetical protein